MIGLALLLLLAWPAAAQVVTSAPPRQTQLIAHSGTAVTNTAIGTSEVNMASVPFPPLAANDTLRITTFWDTSGSVATNDKRTAVRLSTTACTPLAACTAGSIATNFNMNTTGIITNNLVTTIRNSGATNAQVMLPTAASTGFGPTNAASATIAVQTNAGGFVNIDSITATASTDTIRLLGYTIELIPGT